MKDPQKHIIENCKHPPKFPSTADPTVIVDDQPYRILSMLMIPLRVSFLVVKHFEDTSCPLTAEMISWNSSLNSFHQKWNFIVDLKEADVMGFSRLQNK